MNPTPKLTIVVPVHNDETTIGNAIASCLAQTVTDIEVICVDDASTDDTFAVLSAFAATDERVRVMRSARTETALQARRRGVEAARAPYTLFLDGDDELAPHAAQTVLEVAAAAAADIVGFGVVVIDRRGRTGGAYQKRLAPRHRELGGTEVLRGLFPLGSPAQGQLWRHAYRTKLLSDAYSLIPDSLTLPRVNDLPLMFLAACLADSYVSVPDELYRYHFGRGGSGQRITDLETAEFYASAIDSIDSIARAVTRVAADSPRADDVHAAYRSARLSIIGLVCHQIAEHARGDLVGPALDSVYARVSARDVATAVVSFWPDALDALASHGGDVPLQRNEGRTVMLVTMTLTTGGISNVLCAQARILTEAGYRVVIMLRGTLMDPTLVPEGVSVHRLRAVRRRDRPAKWLRTLIDEDVDVVIDHEILSGRDWPHYAGLSRAAGVPTIGWIHNFALRPLLDGTDRVSRLRAALPVLQQVVTLSPLDVVFWKLMGVSDVVFLANPPPQPLGIGGAARTESPAGRVELVWVGRLEQHTKRVLDLLTVAEHLVESGLDFRLTLVGPDWMDLSASAINRMAARRGLGANVRAIGALHGEELVRLLDHSDIFVSTSIVEGYQLTLVEAGLRGLPVCMYALPWLLPAQSNAGITQVPQGDAEALARAVLELTADAERYAQASRHSLEAAHRTLAHDYASLYAQLIEGSLPASHSPDPNLADAAELVRLAVFFADHRSSSAEPGRRGRSVPAALTAPRAFARRVARRLRR